MLNSKDIQQQIQEQVRFWSSPFVRTQLSHCANLQVELNLLKETLAREQQALPNEQKYCVEMSAYVANLQLQKESMETFLENKENHEWLTNILRFSMVMERVSASLAKPWSIAERTVNLSLDPDKPLLCDVFSEPPKLTELYDAVQAITAPRNKTSAEQRCVIDSAKKTSVYYIDFISTRAELQKIAAGPKSNEFLAWGRAKLNKTYSDYNDRLPTLLEQTRALSSRVCGKRNDLAYTIRVNEAQFKEMTESHGSLKGLEAKIVEQRKVLTSAGKQYEARAQKINALQSDIAELQLRLDCATGRKPVYTDQTNNFAARAA